MLHIARRFESDMDQIIVFVELTESIFNLAKHDLKSLRSKAPLALAAREVHFKTRQLRLGTAVPYEGAYLSACAQFELVIRDLIDFFVSEITKIYPTFQKLPKAIQDAQIEGCKKIIPHTNKDKFKHLSLESVLTSLLSCIDTSGTKSYNLIAEAFSNNEQNFKPDVISNHMKRIGCTNIWSKISKEHDLKVTLGTVTDTMTESVARERLKSIMDRRNQIIHRGKQLIIPSESEIKECAVFFKSIVLSITKVMMVQISKTITP